MKQELRRLVNEELCESENKIGKFMLNCNGEDKRNLRKARYKLQEAIAEIEQVIDDRKEISKR